MYIYNSRRSEPLIIKFSITEIMKVKNIEEKHSINNEKNILCTRENGSRLKMFSRPKHFDILPDLIHTLSRRGGGEKKRRWFSVTRGMGKVGGRTFCLFVCLFGFFASLFVNYSL